MSYHPPVVGQEVQPFEMEQGSIVGNTNRVSFDEIRSSQGPYSEIEQQPLVSESGRHRFSTHEEDALIIRGSTSHSGKASIGSSVINLTNTILGAGLLGLSYAIAHSGYILGVILFLIFGFLSSVGLHLLMASARLVPDASFYTLSEKTIPGLKKAVDLAVAIKCFGVGTSYFIVVGDLMPDVFTEFLNKNDYNSDNIWLYNMFCSRRFWITLFSIFLIAPVVRLKKMDSLRITSAIAIGCFVYVVIVVLLYAFVPDLNPCQDSPTSGECKGSVDPFPTSFLGFVRVIPIYIFGFTCHQNAFAITNELRRPIMSRLNRVIMISMGSCIVVYTMVSYSGYFTYGSECESDILLNYPQTILVALVRIGLSIAVAFSYPLQCHPCRRCLSSLIWTTDSSTLTNKKFYGLTYCIFICSFMISMFVTDLGIVLALVGATGSTTISYILPGLFYYRSFEKQLFDKTRYVALFMVVMGCMLIPFAVTVQFI